MAPVTLTASERFALSQFLTLWRAGVAELGDDCAYQAAGCVCELGEQVYWRLYGAVESAAQHLERAA